MDSSSLKEMEFYRASDSLILDGIDKINQHTFPHSKTAVPGQKMKI